MQTRHVPDNVFEESYDALKDRDRVHTRVTKSDAICGALGLLLLMCMLLIATGTVPIYEWHKAQ